MPSPSFILAVGTTLLSALVTPAVAQSYALADTFHGSNFFDNFNFFTARDPTNGFVTYVSRERAQQTGLISATSSRARMSVDSRTVLSRTGPGRNSVRIESKNSYTRGLFIADIQHMPGAVCGVWPAFWSLGSGPWPANGEIDIIEGVNRNVNNAMILHTSDGCSVSGTGQTGTLLQRNCAVSFSTSGCGVSASGSNNYGNSFNANGGGVYAMQWTSTFIKIWFFQRGSIPSSITSGRPNPATFGVPQANFAAPCNISRHFREHRFIFDTTFCGDYAGNTWQASRCPMYPNTDQIQSCVRYVAENPSLYSQSYWDINSLKIYREV